MTARSPLPLAVALLTVSLPAFSASLDPVKKPNLFTKQKPITARSPSDEVKAIELPSGYHLQTVLTEPDIKEPVAIAFDGDGRMYVAEMRSYMQDIDGTKEHDPVCRVSVHWSSKHNGVYDKHAVFADKLILPRIMLPLDKGRVLIGETDTNDLYIYSDTNGDGVSDKKELFYQGGPRGGNLEHQPSGPVWAIDNWLYTTYNAYRLRWSPDGKTKKENTAPNGGQWGVSQDDWGKIWFVNAGGEKGPVNFQTGIVYGAFNTKDQLEPDFETVWPKVGLADVQGGESRFREENGTLNHFTATCGGEIYRGDCLPDDLRGDLLFGEPVGRLVRRAKVSVWDGITHLNNLYDKSEFIRSTDPLFRPINFNTAPDGTLYITDMYRGIIQEGNWVKEDSYLRKAVLQYGLDKPIGRGRIYRLVHDDMKPGPEPHMNSEKPAELVAHLEHPNGWWRDMAQRLLVLKQDKSVVPALVTMAKTSKNPLARLHALWTIEGLDSLTADLVREKLKDENPHLRAAAIRVSETLYKKGDKSFAADINDATKDKDGDVVLQALLTAKLLNITDWKKTIETVVAASTHRGVKEIGDQILHPPVQQAPLAMNGDQQKLYKAGEGVFQTLCATCHGMDGKGMPMVGGAPGVMLAPPLAGSRTLTGWREGGIDVLLQGLSGDIDGKKYEGQMISMATNDDNWIAGVLSYVRNSFGNRAGFVTPQEVAAVRTATKSRTQPWTISELRASLPKAMPLRKSWTLSASHKTDDTRLAVDDNIDTRYSTGAPQAPGMWFQIELPVEALVAGLELDAGKSPNDYPRGYKVEISSDGSHWKEVASGKGTTTVTNIQFSPAKAKMIRITQTDSTTNNFWSIHELQVFEAKETVVASAVH